MREFNEIRTNILDNFEDIFETYDVIISPVASCPPFDIKNDGRCFEINGQSLNPLLNFLSFGQTPIVNFIGYPAASIPAGLTKQDLPTGMQIIGKQYDDETVLAICKTFEDIQPWNYDVAFNRVI